MTKHEPKLLELNPADIDYGTLGNRIRKNYRHWKKWAKRTESDVFRIYDRDIPQYPLAIDYYAGRFNIQYFFTSHDEDYEIDPAFQKDVNSILTSIFIEKTIQDSDIFWKFRKRRKRLEQYEKLESSKNFFVAMEYGIPFLVNLSDYLDCGLFIDHRETRQYVRERAKGKRVLNLFAYTGSFSVYAAAGGADFTMSVDMSNTYCQWTRDNFDLNELDLSKHRVLRQDCLVFLKELPKSGWKYDLIVLDPPTLSRSKKMEDIFDVQRDHAQLIREAALSLDPGGEIIFSTNSRKFVLADTITKYYDTIELTEKLHPADFRNQKIHYTWLIKNK